MKYQSGLQSQLSHIFYLPCVQNFTHLYSLSVCLALLYVRLSISAIVHHVTLVFSCEGSGKGEQKTLSFLPAHFSTVRETVGQMPVS